MTSKVLFTDNNFGDDARLERALAADSEIELVVGACRSEEDVRVLVEAHEPDVLIVQFAPVGRRVLRTRGRLRGVVRCGVGLDNVDTRAADEAGIAVSGVPDYCVDEVADHALALMLAVERRVVALARDVAAGGWDWQVAGSIRRLRGRTLGLVGLGRIGRAVQARARAFGLEVVAYDPFVNAASAPSLEALLGVSDILSLHVPLTDDTRNLISRRELDLLPRGSVLINVSRGGLVDETALRDALDTGHLRGAGLDVLAGEPPDEAHPLRHAPNVVLTPHAAWYSDEAIQDLRRRAFQAAVRMTAAAT